MKIRGIAGKRRRVERLFDDPPPAVRGSFAHVARGAFERRDAILALAERWPTPFYAFDPASLADGARRFREAFDPRLPGHVPFYAAKSNDHPWVLRRVVRAGFGIDVSSAREHRAAVAAGASRIVFSGPAKSDDDHALAIADRARTIVHLDSFGELARLVRNASRARRTIRAGVRVFTRSHGAWSKFGIPLEEVGAFVREAARHPYVRLEGIQLHSSWQRSGDHYRRTIDELARALATRLTEEERAGIRFVDFGGGFRPHRLEGYFPHDHPLGAVVRAADEHFGRDTRFDDPYLEKPSVPLDDYATAIGRGIARRLAPLVPKDCAYYTEPGRVISTWAMHLVTRVVDRKRDGVVVVDGGIHMVGWEKYLHVHAPVVNLTRPAEKEIDVHLYGSLCDAEDTFGARCFASDVREGDVLAIPFQGAYSYSTAQAFIREIPAVRRMKT